MAGPARGASFGAAPFLTEGQRSQKLRRCLNDNNLPLRVRFGRTVTLLYGMRAGTVRLLTASDLGHDTDGIYLSLGRQALFVPPRPAALVTELADQASRSASLAVSPSPRAWLFPGTVPDSRSAPRASAY